MERACNFASIELKKNCQEEKKSDLEKALCVSLKEINKKEYNSCLISSRHIIELHNKQNIKELEKCLVKSVGYVIN